MTQVEKTGFRWSRLILGLAVVALGFAVAQAVKNRSSADEADGPAAAASAPSDDPLATLEARTRERPDDASAWAALGGGQFDAGRFAESVTAYEKATGLAPGTASFWSSLGEARVMASSTDPMPDAARAAFEKALAQDPKDPRARYFMAVARDLSGDHKGAIDDWLALLADTPPGAPWEADLRRTIEQVARINKVDVSARLATTSQPAPQLPVAARGIPGPSAEDLRAASAMPPSEQREMAQGMVARLEARLKDNPANVDGWIMLIRSRVTLGEPDKAKQALADAVAANPASAGMIREQAALLGGK
ncbi:MAG TPA: tetratricopeptide repeat protein [Novosphingobium sp.]|nr:tetratricopeptide repeat protein [Novosphingobium sp.]